MYSAEVGFPQLQRKLLPLWKKNVCLSISFHGKLNCPWKKRGEERDTQSNWNSHRNSQQGLSWWWAKMRTLHARHVPWERAHWLSELERDFTLECLAANTLLLQWVWWFTSQGWFNCSKAVLTQSSFSAFLLFVFFPCAFKIAIVAPSTASLLQTRMIAEPLSS